MKIHSASMRARTRATCRPHGAGHPAGNLAGHPGGHAAGRPLRPNARPRQGGVFGIMAVGVVLVMAALCGLALDLGMVYNRKVNVHGMARAAALAAARELDGTAAGIANARARARETAERFLYDYGSRVAWSDSALAFGAAPARAGTWMDAAGASAAPAALFFAKVDTTALDAGVGAVSTVFMPVLSASFRTVQVGDVVVAGRPTVDVVPIAVCAMSTEAAGQRTNPNLATPELLQYGFRRGVSYDLMQLNPNGTSPVRYLINPVLYPGMTSAVFDTSLVGQFVCTGTMWTPRLTGGPMRVSPLPGAAPLAALYRQLNSRFDDYSGNVCSAYGAPPDFNVRAYAYGQSGAVAWMTPATGSAAAASTTQAGRLETIADLPEPPQGMSAGQYGPLWAYAKAAKYAQTEPAGGYSTFGTGDWANLYRQGPTASSYPSTTATPYLASVGANFLAPSSSRREFSTENRRVLNIPLLSCPVGGGSNVAATVVGIGRFFMTVPATEERLVAEFAGMASPKTLRSLVEVYP